jgi:hypothetical protein
VIFAGAAAIAMLALFDVASLSAGGTTAASGSARLVDQAADLPAPTLTRPIRHERVRSSWRPSQKLR